MTIGYLFIGFVDFREELRNKVHTTLNSWLTLKNNPEMVHAGNKLLREGGLRQRGLNDRQIPKTGKQTIFAESRNDFRSLIAFGWAARLRWTLENTSTKVGAISPNNGNDLWNIPAYIVHLLWQSIFSKWNVQREYVSVHCMQVLRCRQGSQAHSCTCTSRFCRFIPDEGESLALSCSYAASHRCSSNANGMRG